MRQRLALLMATILLTTGCASMMVWRSPGISGEVRLVNASGSELKGNRKGVVVNLINLSGELGDTSFSVTTDEEGKFVKTELPKGAYKVEAVKDGYKIASLELTLGSHERRSLQIDLVRLSASKRRTIKMKKGREEINNPGQVNIQPPSM